MAQHHPVPSSHLRPRCESYPKPTHRIPIYGASIHPASFSVSLPRNPGSSDSSLARLAGWSTDWMLLEASYCRYEHLHDPPGPSGSNASTHQWPYCPLRLPSNLLSTETRYRDFILGGNSRNPMRENKKNSSEFRLFRSHLRARVRDMKMPDTPCHWFVPAHGGLIANLQFSH